MQPICEIHWYSLLSQNVQYVNKILRYSRNLMQLRGFKEGILTSMVRRWIPTGALNARNAHIHSPAGGFRENSLPNDNINMQYINHFTAIQWSLHAGVVELLLLKTRMHENKSLKAQKGTLIMRQIEGLGVGLLAKAGSKLSQRYGKNKAFQEF